MKKLLILIIMMLSFSLVYFTFNDVNENQATNVYAFNNTVKEQLKEKQFSINVLYDETDQFQDVIQKIGQFAKEHQATLVVSNEYKDLNGIYTITDHYIVTSQQNIFDNYFIEGKQIDFTDLLNSEFYSTMAESNAVGMMKILDNGYEVEKIETNELPPVC